MKDPPDALYNNTTMTPITPLPVSPSSSAASPSSAADTPVAIDPSPLAFPVSSNINSSKVYYLEGIPEQLGRQQQPQPPVGFDNASIDSVLSSLDDAEELSLDESYYFTPLETRPPTKIDKLKRELQLRSELLVYLAQGQSPAYVAQLRREEETVQAWTLAAARQREDDRAHRRAERRRQRHQQQQQQQQHSQQPLQQESPVAATPNNNTASENMGGRRPTAQEAVAPKLLQFGSSPAKSQQQQQQQQQQPSSQPTTTRTTLFSAYCHFEWYHGMPAVVSMLLACVAHIALYELVLAVVLVGMQPFLSYRILTDSEDRILAPSAQNVWVEDACYFVVLVFGLILARCSGLIFSFKKSCNNDDDDDQNDDNSTDNNNNKSTTWMSTSNMTISPQERHLDPRRVDRQWAKWMHYSKKGRLVKGMVDVVSFYLCFVAVMYFLGRFALCVDQRASLLDGMPSAQHQHHNNPTQQLLLDTNNNLATTTSYSPVDLGDVGTCPSHVNDILLPNMMEYMDDDDDDERGDGESSSSSGSSSDDSDDDDEPGGISYYHEWDLPECDDVEDNEDDNIIYESGPEDETYLYQHLSASVYHQFWGYGYRAALFDLPHQLFFNLACSVVAIYTLKRYFGCSFWEDW